MVEQQWGIAEGALKVPTGTIPSYQPAPRGTLAGTVLTITALLLAYVGIMRLMF